MLPRAHFALIAALVFQFGCAATVVKKDPGPKDRGIRYWRPKPYLLVTPVPAANVSPDSVQLSITYLPDYNEEYSIHVRAGIGTNTTNVKLNDGWNLTGIDVSVDSKVTDLINSMANLATAGAGFRGATPGTPSQCEFKIQAKAHLVPLGLYEAVVNCDEQGCKKLCGWRYVGFAPFAGCNTQVSGCDGPPSSELYGLVLMAGCPRFCKLSEIGDEPKASAPPAIAPKPISNGPHSGR